MKSDIEDLKLVLERYGDQMKIPNGAGALILERLRLADDRRKKRETKGQTQ